MRAQTRGEDAFSRAAPEVPEDATPADAATAAERICAPVRVQKLRKVAQGDLAVYKSIGVLFRGALWEGEGDVEGRAEGR